MFTGMNHVRAANKALGHFFFSPDTLRFFGSRMESPLVTTPAGQFFVTSEDNFDRTSRQFSVRTVNPDGSIDTMDEGYAVESRRAAIALIPR